jgi:acetyl-CoA C-acetyltransferase
MAERVAILGAGMTKLDDRKGGQKLDDMVFEATRAALLDSGITQKEIDSVVLVGCDEFDGHSISSMLVAAAGGSYLKDEIKVTDDGIYGVILAAMRILSGLYDLSVIVSWCKPSEAPVSNVMNMRWDPFYHRPFGLNHISTAALMAGAYLDRYKGSDAAAAAVAVKNRANGARNQNAHLQKSVTIDDVRSSAPVSWPLRALDCAPESDGACALVLASAKKTREIKQKPVWLEGFGWAVDSYYLGERDLADSPSLRVAAGMAYRQAGIENPIREIDMAEICDFTSYYELIACEALGLCGAGGAAHLLQEGTTRREGAFPVNPSGGLLSSNPFVAAGLFRAVEVYLQVSGRAGRHQVPGVRRALAQGSTGFCAQGNAVLILSAEG